MFELRWLERPVAGDDLIMDRYGYFSIPMEKVLQYRTKTNTTIYANTDYIETFNGYRVGEVWSDWKDAPTVEVLDSTKKYQEEYSKRNFKG